MTRRLLALLLVGLFLPLPAYSATRAAMLVTAQNTPFTPSTLGTFLTTILNSVGTLADTNTWTGTNSFTGVSIQAQATPTLVLAGGTCAGTVIVGGLAGKVTLTGACASTNTMTLSVLPATTNDYVCTAQNRTTPATLINETSTTSTTVVFTFAGTTSGATDVLQYSCQGY